MNTYLLHIAVEACVLSLLAISLNLLAGYGRLVSLGQLTFYALGSYSAAILATSFGYVVAFPVGLAIAASVAWLVSAATTKLKEDEFAIATFAVHIAFWSLLMNWQNLTNGPLGISGIPPMHVFSFLFDVPTRAIVIAGGLLTIAQILVWRMSRSPYGFALRMLQSDEELARNFGRDVGQVRRSLWVLSGVIAASAGLFQASYLGYVNPASFSSIESTILLAVVILGGAGTYWGPVLGAVAMTCVPEALRFLGLPAVQAANLRQMLLGAVLVVAAFQMSAIRGGGRQVIRPNSDA